MPHLRTVRRSAFLTALLLSWGASSQDPVVLHHWSGALEATGIRVHALLSAPCDNVRLVVDDDPAFNSPSFSIAMSADSAHGLMARLRRGGLLPSTSYGYRFEVAGTIDTNSAHTGHFRTPGLGAASFSFIAGACNTNSDHPVWQSMAWFQPHLFIATGDLHYGDPAGIDVQTHRDAYIQGIYQHPGIMDLLHRVPIAYVWDDHDFCGDGSNGNAPGKAAAAQAYREHVPHYYLPHDTSVYQSFTIGRVHFILSDLRSSKTAARMMDDPQREWLREQLLFARDSGLVTCWISPMTWNAQDYPENWGCQPQERAAMGDWLLENHIENLFILSGDAHMLAIDDGANADFSAGHQSPYRYPIFQAAAINRNGSYKGGTFNQGGYFPNPGTWVGQFGQVLVDDDGEEMCITFNGWRTDSMSAAVSLLNTYTFCRQPQPYHAVDEPPRPEGLRLWYDGWQGLVLEGLDPIEPLDLRVIDVAGRVLVQRADTPSDDQDHVLLGHLSSGSYLAIARNGGKAVSTRFFVHQ